MNPFLLVRPVFDPCGGDTGPHGSHIDNNGKAGTVTVMPTYYGNVQNIIDDAQNRLIELGGGTDYGVAGYLERIGIEGKPGCAEACPVAEWFVRELRAAGVAIESLEVMPNGTYPEMAHVSWLEWGRIADPDTVQLLPILNELADQVDEGLHPELVARPWRPIRHAA